MSIFLLLSRRGARHTNAALQGRAFAALRSSSLRSTRAAARHEPQMRSITTTKDLTAEDACLPTTHRQAKDLGCV